MKLSRKTDYALRVLMTLVDRWGTAPVSMNELAQLNDVPKRFLGKITGWVEKHGAWSVGISAILPPPVPLTPFLLAAGALKVPRGSALVFYGIARTLRSTFGAPGS